VRQPALVFSLTLAALLFGCSAERDAFVPTVEVEPDTFEMTIRAFGELQAAKATPLQLPRSMRGVQRIAKLVDEGQPVAAGEIICEMDADPIDRMIDTLRNNIAKIDFQVEAKRQELTKERRKLEGQLALARRERADAVSTAPQDETIFSRHEIIEASINLELIDTKLAYMEEQMRRLDSKEETELEILLSQRRTGQTRLDQQLDAREQLAIRAPHDGIFLPGRTWQGETVRVGMEIFGGQSIGELPDLSTMEARLHVLEAEASGLADGLAGEVRLDAFPGFSVTGKLSQIQPVANPLDRQSPVKYFEVVMTLDETDVTKMRPGAQVEATIFVKRHDDRLSVPNQAVFIEGGEPWVYVRRGSDFERRSVELGERSLSRTVINGGIEPGETVALVDPFAGRKTAATDEG
jgi:multidrug efflux pump subunit AcrA (membrane-fusion protein)